MNLKNFFRKFSSIGYSKHFNEYRKLTREIVSVFLILIILVTGTYSWFVIKDTSGVDSASFTLNAGNGLRVNEGEDLTNHIRLENIRLEEASSVDGRNFFFPTTGTFDDETDNMVFREGNAGDKNIKYWYEDFTLTGDSGVTYVYIKSYSILIGDEKKLEEVGNEKFDGSTKIRYENGIPVEQEKHEECPIRLALLTDSSEKPTVIDPTALVGNYVHVYNAVNATNSLGIATTAKSNASPFSDFYFGTGDPVFTLRGNESVSATLVVWMEGTGDNWDVYADKDITVDIELESNWSDMEIITFVDDTIGDDGSGQHWIQGSGNGACIVIMSYTDIDGSNKSVVMEEIDNTHWFAYMPKDITTNISFYRYSLKDEVIYNAWHTKVKVNDELNDTSRGWANNDYKKPLQESRIIDGVRETTYTAKRGNGHGEVKDSDPDLDKKRLSPCIGYWGDTGSSGGGSGGGESGTRAKGNLSLEIPDGDLNWMRNDLSSSGNYDMYAVFSNGEKLKMNYDNNGKCSVNYDVPYGTRLTSFQQYRKSDNSQSDGKPTISITPLTLTHSDYNYSFRVTNYGQNAVLLS